MPFVFRGFSLKYQSLLLPGGGGPQGGEVQGEDVREEHRELRDDVQPGLRLLGDGPDVNQDHVSQDAELLVSLCVCVCGGGGALTIGVCLL